MRTLLPSHASIRRTIAACLVATVVAASGCKRAETEEYAARSRPPAVTTLASGTPWCSEGWRALDDGNCLALPDRFVEPASLVIFAHGISSPDARPTADQATLLAVARKLGFAVLSTRGKKGLCDWEPKFADQLCWPVRRETVDRESASILSGWTAAQALAAEAAKVHFERRYVIGFSNGGYFTAFVCLEGLTPMDGAAVVGSGRTEIDERRMSTAHPPLYLAVGDQEAEATRQDAENMARVLERHGWPVKYVVHPQRGHELREDDVANAWAAWGR